MKQVALNVGDLNMAGYRSGYNGAVLKTVGGDEPSVGSNPTPAAMPGYKSRTNGSQTTLIVW